MYDNAADKYNIADQGRTKNYNNMGFSAEFCRTSETISENFYRAVCQHDQRALIKPRSTGNNYSYNGLNKQPILPPAQRFYFIGAFLSWGNRQE
jgi:hypothetical protein